MNNPDSALSSSDIVGFLTGRFHSMENFILPLEMLTPGGDPFGPNRHSRILFLTNPGSNIGHFVLLSDMGDCYEYFDPRGNPPPDPVLKFAAGKTICWLSSPLQSPESFLCGHWCIQRYLSLPTPLDTFAGLFLDKKNRTPDEVMSSLIRVKTREE